MANYAIYKDTVIINVVFAENKEIVETLTGMNAIETEGSPWIGWTLIGGEWVAPITEVPEDFEQLNDMVVQED